RRGRKEKRDEHRGGGGDAERIEELAYDVGHERDRREPGDDRESGGEYREADLLGSFARRRIVVLAEVDVPYDVLAHHDRVVDQQTDAKRERHQRHVVQREVEGVQRDERRDHGDRQRKTGDDGAAPRAEEQENDQHG